MMKRIFETAAAFAAAALVVLLMSVCTSASAMNDVSVGDWYYADVVRLQASGVLGGYPDGNFYPGKEMTCAEFAKVLISCMGAAEDKDSAPEVFSGHWASGYIGAAYSSGILTDEDVVTDFSPDKPITRRLMTKMTVLALGLEPAHIASPFIDADDPYANAAYRAYILRGYDTGYGNRVCHGDSNATRAEAASVAVRIMDYSADPYGYKKRAVLENAGLNSLDSEAELIDFFYILNREFITEYTFRTKLPYEEWAEAYRTSNLIHFDSFYSEGYDCSYIPGNNVYTITLRYTYGVDNAKLLFVETENTAKIIIGAIITDGMTKEEKIRVIHDYLVLNCTYDLDNYNKGTIPVESYMAYGALCKKVAVCQGYTNAFNLLCKHAGIPSITVSGTAPGSYGGHSWNMVLVDGAVYAVDVTGDDPVPDEEGRVISDKLMIPENELNRRGYRYDVNSVKREYFH